MTAAQLTKILALATLTVTMLVTAVPSQAAIAGEPCNIDADDNSSLVPCYQSELDEKTKANDKYYRQIVKEAKARGRVKKGKKLKAKTKAKAKAKAYAEFIERLTDTVIDSRKSALRSCVHMTGKFQDKELSDSAIANCRTEAELQLEKQLRNYETELTLLGK